MIYYDSTNKTGISQEIDSLCDSNDTSYPVADKERRINEAVRQIEGMVLGSDGSWDYDGTNYTDLPIATATLVNGQQDYSFDDAFLEIKSIRVLDDNGIWHKLKPFDRSQVDIAVDELLKTDGMPRYYDKQGRSVFLYPAPATANVTLASGLKIDYSRVSTLITDLSGTDASKSPGFDPYDSVIAYMVSVPYCMTYKRDRVADYRNEVTRLQNDIRKLFGRRMADVKKTITGQSVNAI